MLKTLILLIIIVGECLELCLCVSWCTCEDQNPVMFPKYLLSSFSFIYLILFIRFQKQAPLHVKTFADPFFSFNVLARENDGFLCKCDFFSVDLVMYLNLLIF